ncbi:MAG: hypothetical protein ACXAEI_08690 [Candidatus Hodarchaeales archaeon]|jgi:hypothetical protein
MKNTIIGAIMIAFLLSFQFPLSSASARVVPTIFGHSWSEPAFAFEIDLNDRTGSYSLLRELTPGELDQEGADSNTTVDFEQFFAYINTSRLELAVIAQERWKEEIATDIQISFEGTSFDVPITSKIDSSIPLVGFLGHLEHLSAEYYFGGAFLGLMLNQSSESSQSNLLVGYPLSDIRLLEGLQDYIEEKTDLSLSLRNSDASPFFEVGEDFFQLGVCYKDLTIFWHNESLSDGIILSSSSFGMATFSWFNLSFMLRPNFGHIQGMPVASLIPSIDVGPITFLAMSEDEIPSGEWTEHPKLIEVELNLKEILGILEIIPGQSISYKETFRMGVYNEADISTRLSMEAGLRLSVLMALNSYSSSSEDLERRVDGQLIDQPLQKFPIESNLTIYDNGKPTFLMNHLGKDRYLSYDVEGEQSLKKAYISGILSTEYSQLSSALYDEEYHLFDTLLNPFIGNTTSLFANTTQAPSNLIDWGFSTTNGHYLLELDHWNGMELSYDPEFLFFLTENSLSRTQPSSSVSTTIVEVFLSLLCLLLIQNSRSRRKRLKNH